MSGVLLYGYKARSLGRRENDRLEAFEVWRKMKRVTYIGRIKKIYFWI